MTQKITQMRLVRYLFTAVLALLFVNCSKQVEDEIGFGQREVTLQVGETSKVTLHRVRNPRIENSNSNLVEATLVEQGTAVSLTGLQAGEGTIKVLSSNRYAELRVVVKANKEDLNSPFNGKNIIWNKITSNDYTLRDDSLTLAIWRNDNTKNLDLNRDPLLRKIKVIGSYVFASFNNLTNVNISRSTTTIRDYAFAFCKNLTGVNISNSVTSIGEGAFYDCSSLTNIHIPNSVTNIEKSAFGACRSLMSINIPNSVTSIEEYAFADCSNLTSVVFEGSNPPRVTKITDIFENAPNNLKLIVPKGAKTRYIRAGYPEDRLIEK